MITYVHVLSFEIYKTNSIIVNINVFFSFAVFMPKNRSAKIQLLICKLIMLVKSAGTFTIVTFLIILKMHFKLFLRRLGGQHINYQICFQNSEMLSHEIIWVKKNLFLASLYKALHLKEINIHVV